MRSNYDVVILGAGHNGLVAATYLSRAGLSVLLLEKNDYIGGATASQKVFPDYDARLSRYSYLVSLFPEKIIHELGLGLELRRREIASFTPYQRAGKVEELILSNVSQELGRESMRTLTGNDREFEQMTRFYDIARIFAGQVWDTMLDPLQSKETFRKRFEKDELHREAWRSLAEEPLGFAVERYLKHDLLRGLVFTDAKIGVLTHPEDPSLLQNRCFLYHVIGNKTGEWKVPVGGMGRVADALEQAAKQAGAEMLTRAAIKSLELEKKKCEVTFSVGGKEKRTAARFLLVNFGRNVFAKLLNRTYQAAADDEGSVFKINMLLQRLPRLKSQRHTAREAFCGTFHSDEGYEQMKESFAQAIKGDLPQKPPGEVYCHTLTDDSILSPELRREGFHTMTLFGLDMPWRLFSDDNPSRRHVVEKNYIQSINQWLAEPLEDCLARARDGSPCIESKTPVDLEESLGLYHGNIFQDAPTFPFAANTEQVGKWGVETEFENVYLCGSAAYRGGAVSGIPGHNAAMKVLEAIRQG